MKEIQQTHARQLAPQPCSFRAYEDNYKELNTICKQSGRKPTDELRDLLDEAIKARHQRESSKGVAANPGQVADKEDIAKLIELLQQVMQKSTNHNQLIVRLANHMREQYGLILETLGGAYSVRHLVWKYIAGPILRGQGLNPEQIRNRYEEESQVWNRQRDSAADTIEQAIKSLVTSHKDTE
jgi:hypothetical protein